MDTFYYFHKSDNISIGERVYSTKQYKLLDIGEIFELNEYNFHIIWDAEKKSFERLGMKFGKYKVIEVVIANEKDHFNQVILIPCDE